MIVRWIGKHIALGYQLETRGGDFLPHGGRVNAMQLLRIFAARARTLMDRHAGIVRDADGLDEAFEQLRSGAARDTTCLVAAAVVAAAATRTTSIGCHLRADSPEHTFARPGRVEVRLDDDGVPNALMRGDAELPLAMGVVR